MTWLMLIANVALLLGGQLCWKRSLVLANGFSLHSLPSLFVSPFFLLGALCYAAATICWLFVLSRLPLSVAYPLQSLAFLLALFADWLLFGADIPVHRWIGTCVILAGVLIVSLRN